MKPNHIMIGLTASALCAALATIPATAASATASDSGASAQRLSIRGGDISSLKKGEDHGAVYLDAAGRRRDPLKILKGAGMNWARLRVWVDPADGYNNKARTLEMARRIKASGMKLLVDFHYSDAWADPGKQNKPAAWAALDFAGLEQAVHDHTFDVLSGLRAQGTTADMVQIGNEINGGMLWPDGHIDNWDNLAALLTSGARAVKEVSGSTKVMLHLAEGGDTEGATWWFDNAVAREVPFDVIGLSHYTYFHGPLSDLRRTLDTVTARYDKDVVVAETAYGFTLDQGDFLANIFDATRQEAGGYPATPQGQEAALRDLAGVVAATPGGHGLGFFYWEPTWTAVPGNGWDPTDPASGDAWENQALFDYDNRLLPAAGVYGSG